MQFIAHSPDASEPSFKPRHSACSVCHRRKIKCNAHAIGYPCTNCSRADVADCRPHQKRRRGNTDVASRTEQKQAADPGPSSSAPSADPSTVASHGDHLYHDHLKQIIEHEAGHLRLLDGEARVVFLGTDASNLSFLFRQHSANGRVLHRPADRIEKELTVYIPQNIPQDAFSLPDRATVDRLLHAYFKHINPGFPIVDEDRFMKLYEARDPTSPPSLLLLQAILMVGAHVLSSTADRQTAKRTYYHRAKLLFDSRFERNRDLTVQAALLLAWHSDGVDDAAANSWFWTRTAATVALGLGMHRDADDSTLAIHNKHMWRRIFWLLFRQDVLVSMAYGRPQTIRLDECDVKPLERADFTECGINTMTDFAISSVELAIIISDTMINRFAPRIDRARRQQALIKADEALAMLSMNLPESLALRSIESMAFWPSILQLIYHTFLIVLHRPMTGQPEHECAQTDIGICSTAAGVVQSLLERICQSAHVNTLFNYSVHSAFTALVQFNVEARLPNQLLATNASRRFESTLQSLEVLTDYWPNAINILRLCRQTPTIGGDMLKGGNNPVGPGVSQVPVSGQAHGMTKQWAPADADNRTVEDDQFNWKNLFPVETVETPQDLFSWNTEWRDLYYHEPI